MADIVLTTLNARYLHCAFGLRYLKANLGDLTSASVILEFQVQQRPLEIAERLLAENPRIIGFGVYIWNSAETLRVVSLLKRVRPGLLIVLGGPEVSYETERQPLAELADVIITGEADLEFRRVCADLLERGAASVRVVTPILPDLARLRTPYHLYTEEDLRQRVVYVEASRGCPFLCEFCLSSLDVPVRAFPLEGFLAQMQELLNRGLRSFKFVDRTFNLHLDTSRRILEFFLERYRPGLFLHLEMIPDRLPAALRELVRRFPSKALQFEVGIQSFNSTVNARIRRRQNNETAEENLQWLRQETGVHLHTDLIVGLPGESWESFAAGFDRLVRLRPHEIQVGILKRLRGTSLDRHAAEHQTVFDAAPPYELLQSAALPWPQLQRLRRFARYWDLVVNSGRFQETAPRLWGDGSPFAAFMAWSDWLYAQVGRTHEIALPELARSLFRYLVEVQGQRSEEVTKGLARDLPLMFRSKAGRPTDALRGSRDPSRSPRPRNRRQARHDRPGSECVA